ncbi:MAG: rRNA maturation RNase YbeY [Candidatus Nealsonbacteria bacterium RBG_13_36_15]|uniref:Endoribonuclease YbeY n=1 Tax=Candidatus Nealsonbacteria bacterium RBG_13_36_15 TaxID=1801660 RepID=A0A1G2DXP9_9BACT|nr:MAG: rRNA maturation RNase YbeY [Candidatus Nealsonbacteria bacterium RBG_13_36_15]
MNNITTIDVNKERLKSIARKVLREENIEGKIELSIALVGPTEIKKINKRYLGRNKATDVLAFPEFKKNKTIPTRKIKNLGEIIICPIEVKKNARRFNSTFKKELIEVLIHGIMHLLGYDHEKNQKEAEKMMKKQNHHLFKTFNL